MIGMLADLLSALVGTVTPAPTPMPTSGPAAPVSVPPWLMQAAVTMFAAAIGGGGVLIYKAAGERKKTAAEAEQAEANATHLRGEAWRDLVVGLREEMNELRERMVRAELAEEACRTREAALAHRLADLIEEMDHVRDYTLNRRRDDVATPEPDDEPATAPPGGPD